MGGSEGVVDPSARDKYLLQVTAGPSYDPSSHTQVPVNGTSATFVESDSVHAWIRVRIKDYHGLPKPSPSTSPYFSHKQHVSDRYSIAYSFVPKHGIPGADVVMGFDYSHSIRHQLPPGTKYAMKIATSMLDPGLYSDPYCDEPYLYGPALSSWFAFSVGDHTDGTSADEQLRNLDANDDGVISEGAMYPSGEEVRARNEMPAKWKKRRKYFLTKEKLEEFVFEKGRMYHADFFNPHLDFANFALRLPGFSISVARYVDEKTHHLRYVLKNRESGTVLFCVFFRLLFGKELEDTLRQDGEAREDAGEKVEGDAKNPSFVEEKDAAKRKNNEELKTIETKATTTTAHSPQQSNSEAEMQRPADIDEHEDKQQEDQGIVGSATSAASNLATSIYAVYAAMGFANSSSSSSQSEAESRGSSPRPSTQKLHREIDDMDNATVEQFLQAKNSSV